MTEDASEEDEHAHAQRAASRAKDKLVEIQRMFAGMRDELAGDRFWRYQRSVSPGLQEYIEALSFAHYLEHENMITYDQVQGSLSDSEGAPVCIAFLSISE